jgi:hypothetical protein
MIAEIGDKLVSTEIFTKKFVCDLNACKGACCVQGDAGAPLTDAEVSYLESQLELILPFLTLNGKKALKKSGVFYVDEDNDFVTTLMEGGACAFTVFDQNDNAQCGIEKAYEAEAITFKKPISCALFPIRVKKFKDFTALNYEEIPICRPACSCGDQLDIPVFRFLKEPITRAFGREFYQKLEETANVLKGANE